MYWRIAIVPHFGKYLVEYQRRMLLPMYVSVDYPGFNALGEPMTFTRSVVTAHEYTPWQAGDGIKVFYTKALAEDWLKQNKDKYLQGRKT